MDLGPTESGDSSVPFVDKEALLVVPGFRLALCEVSTGHPTLLGMPCKGAVVDFDELRGIFDTKAADRQDRGWWRQWTAQLPEFPVGFETVANRNTVVGIGHRVDPEFCRPAALVGDLLDCTTQLSLAERMARVEHPFGPVNPRLCNPDAGVAHAPNRTASQ
jgi:hypothetical protein